MKRKSISPKERLRLFTLHGGVCHLCGGKVHQGEAWEISHEIPLELGGSDEDDNNKLVAHKKCHRVRTSERDIPMIAKAHRLERKHLGIKTNKRPFPKRIDPWGKGYHYK